MGLSEEIQSTVSLDHPVVVEVTLNRDEYGSQRTDQPENVNFEPIIRGLKDDDFDWDQL